MNYINVFGSLGNISMKRQRLPWAPNLWKDLWPLLGPSEIALGGRCAEPAENRMPPGELEGDSVAIWR